MFWLLLKISKWHIESGSRELPQIDSFQPPSLPSAVTEVHLAWRFSYVSVVFFSLLGMYFDICP